jgi:hypothetical protein
MKGFRAADVPLRRSIAIVVLALIAACDSGSSPATSTGQPAGVAASAPLDGPILPTTAASAPTVVASPDGMPVSGANVIEEHSRGIFFDRRPIAQAFQTVAQASKPTVDALRPISVTDAAGFGQPMTAMNVDIPAGWNAEGGVDWDQSVECPWNGPRMRWSASSPDGLHGIAIFPEMGWQVASGPIDQFDPCPSAPMASPRDYLEFVMRGARPNARVISYRDRPELVAAVNENQRQQPVSPLGAITHHAGELLIGYSLQGHEMRETLIVAMTRVPLAGGAMAANTQITLAVRAPDGLLDFGFVERVRSSLRPDEAWMTRRAEWAMAKWQQARQRAAQSIDAWHQRRMNEITLAGMTQRHQIRMDTIAQIGQINNRIVASTSATNERIHAATIDAVQEVQPWRDPSSGQQVDLSIHYSNAWQLEDGRQFLTNDSNFDPNRDLDVGGRRLEPIR